MMSCLSPVWENVVWGVESFPAQKKPKANASVFLKIIGIASAAVCAILMASVLQSARFGGENNQKAQNLFGAVDQGETVQFPSAKACVALGYDATSCEEGERAASAIAQREPGEISYSSMDECVKVHGEGACHSITTAQFSWLMTGPNMIPTATPSISYKPSVAGFQAAKKDIASGVPLSPTSKLGVVMRSDGKTFTFTK